ncbi:MAG TPA: hypothetical protein DCS43_00060 [Verrucomicrobia bacterium]|nr:hypothetical protein [Verrucomicrobiota bacterium]
MKTNLCKSRRFGFTLVEVMMATAIMSLVTSSAFALFFFIQNSYYQASVQETATHRASLAISRMVYGFGVEGRGLRAASDVTRTDTGHGWVLNVKDADGASAGSFEYRSDLGTIVYTPADAATVHPVADSVSQADVEIDSDAMALSIRVGVERGRYAASKQMETIVKWRN